MPLDNDARRAAFLEEAGWAGARLSHLAGDASGRFYSRVAQGSGETRILMDVAGVPPQSTTSFIAVADYLRENGLFPPEIYRLDLDAGLLLIEDFGDDLFARRIAARPEDETELYDLAIDVLEHLQGCSRMPGLACFDPAEAASICDVAFDWASEQRDPALKANALAALERLLAEYAPGATATALRDFHVENLVYRDGREGLARIGLLDFQDAVIAHPLYDFVSLITDIRRDIGKETLTHACRRMAKTMRQDEQDFFATISVLSLQRNLRILGVFNRLAKRDGRDAYLRFVSRVQARLQDALGHPALAEIRPLIHRALPQLDGYSG
ncbi:aminoglycoside phosphotransferase family protein [Aestuariibius insulae]|uniref:aminoglycoside phosphotransferase family protein n=1 Tax=Aestuariibius insulae TaxID=2058287 RepID=UPI00345EDC3E